MQDVGAIEALALLDERLRPDHLLGGRQPDDEAQDVGARGVIEPEIVHAGDAIARIEDHVHEIAAGVNFSEPVRERELRLEAEALEGLEHAGTVVRLHEDVDVLGVARHVRVVRKRKGAADEKRNPRVGQLLERVDVEVGGRVVHRACSRGFHGALKTQRRRRWRDGPWTRPPRGHTSRCRSAAPRKRGTAGDRRRSA